MNLKIILTHWYYVIKDVQKTHPEILYLFDGFPISYIGEIEVKYEHAE